MELGHHLCGTPHVPVFDEGHRRGTGWDSYAIGLAPLLVGVNAEAAEAGEAVQERPVLSCLVYGRAYQTKRARVENIILVLRTGNCPATASSNS